MRSITQNGSTQTFELDPQLRVSVKAKTGTGASTETYAYTDDSDSPAWTETTAGSQTTWTRTVDGIGAAEAVQSSSGGVKLMLQNLRGDVVAQSSAGGTLSDFSKVDEFGVPKAALQPGVKYAFHGSKQREAVTSGGIVLMGVRLYQPQMGRFLQVDPVLGGGDNPYAYPTDPVNLKDLDGKRWTKKYSYVQYSSGANKWYTHISKTKRVPKKVWKKLFYAGKWVAKKVTVVLTIYTAYKCLREMRYTDKIVTTVYVDGKGNSRTVVSRQRIRSALYFGACTLL